MSDTALETICISGTSPPYRRPAWIIGQVGSEVDLQRRAQTAPGKERQTHEFPENRRPKSTPSRLNVSFHDLPRMRCSRWRQVYSARHRNSLDKDHDDGMTIMLSPGYILSRNKEKINVTIKTDNVFKEGGTQAKSRKNSQRLDEKDIVIRQLRQQIDDLTVVLEEERLNHKINLKQVEESHQLNLEQRHEEHREHIKSVEDDHNHDVEKLKNSFQQQLEEERETADVERARLRGEIESLQGAFEAYKETVAVEMDYKWQRRVKELRDEHDQHVEDELAKQRRGMLHEQSKEIDALNKEFQRQIQILVEDHRKEVDNLMEKFAECVQDSEQLKSALLEMQTLKQRKDELEDNLKAKAQVLRKTQMELEDKAIKLAGFEKHFAEKVEEVDNRYSIRMQGLMSDNTALRRHYITKCEQMFKLKSAKETEQEKRVRTARDVLKAVILTRAKCDVSLAALRNAVPDVRKTRQGTCKDRPTSAPGTREEFATAEQLSSVVGESPLTPTALTNSDPRPHTSHGGAPRSRRTPTETARSDIRGSLIPTPVNVSNQGIQNLRAQREYQS